MAKIQQYLLLLLLLLLPIFLLAAPATAKTPQHIQQMVKNVNLQDGETFTQLRFYVQDIATGPDKTVYTVAQASITPESPTLFGTTQVVDHVATAGVEFDSKTVARFQGIHVLDDLHEAAITANWNVIFTEGPYEGSTLTLLGRVVAHDIDGELTVVAGTGKFLLARGVALKKTVELKPHMVIQFDFYVCTPGT